MFSNLYLLTGQTLENQHDQLYLPVNQPKEAEEKEKKRRKWIAILLPLIVSQVCFCLLRYNFFRGVPYRYFDQCYVSEKNWQLAKLIMLVLFGGEVK